jgi:hypothetical protein
VAAIHIRFTAPIIVAVTTNEGTMNYDPLADLIQVAEDGCADSLRQEIRPNVPRSRPA